MEEDRLEFKNKKSIKEFFEALRTKLNVRDYRELSTKLKINYGTFKLWISGRRSVPFRAVKKWSKKAKLNLKNFEFRIFTLTEILKMASKKGIKRLEKIYGENWASELGKRGKQKLKKILREKPEIYKKWRKSIEKSLRKKFGQRFYEKMGKLGGRKFVEITPPDKLQEQVSRAFKKSFKFRINYKGIKLRSNLELELAKFLKERQIGFRYEKRIDKFYPDFTINNNLIIEVVGLEWKPRIKMIRNKIQRLSELGYDVIIFTYPNMVKYFKNLSVKVVKNLNELDNVLVLNRA